MSKFNSYRFLQYLETSLGVQSGLYHRALPTSYIVISGMTMLYFPWIWFCFISSASLVFSSMTNHFRITEASSIYIILALGIYGLFLRYSTPSALSFEVYQYFVMPQASFFYRGLYAVSKFLLIVIFLLWSYISPRVEFNIRRILCQELI